MMELTHLRVEVRELEGRMTQREEGDKVFCLSCSRVGLRTSGSSDTGSLQSFHTMSVYGHGYFIIELTCPLDSVH